MHYSKDMKKTIGEITILGSKGDKIDSITINTPRSHFINKSSNLTHTHGKRNLSTNSVRYTERAAFTEETLYFQEAKPVFNYLGYSQKEVAEVLEIDTSTISRWNKLQKDELLGKFQSKAIRHIDEIIAKGIKIFDSEENFKVWLNTPNYGLGEIKPIELLKDPYEIELVDNALEAMSWGNFI